MNVVTVVDKMLDRMLDRMSLTQCSIKCLIQCSIEFPIECSMRHSIECSIKYSTKVEVDIVDVDELRTRPVSSLGLNEAKAVLQAEYARVHGAVQCTCAHLRIHASVNCRLARI